jgi:hypothetical protein
LLTPLLKFTRWQQNDWVIEVLRWAKGALEWLQHTTAFKMGHDKIYDEVKGMVDEFQKLLKKVA